MDQLEEILTTCDVCAYTWNARTWTKCPRCCATAKVYEPTASAIQAACLEIQRNWSRREEVSRRVPAYRQRPAEAAVVILDHPRPKPTRGQ
jgi:hypothetical protein